MTTTMTGPEFDLLVIRTVRDRILAGDWTQGKTVDERGHKCLDEHVAQVTLFGAGGGYDLYDDLQDLLREVLREREVIAVVTHYNDTHTQAEVIALLDDVEDILLGEMGVAR